MCSSPTPGSAHTRFIKAGDPERAVRCVTQLAMGLLFLGQQARAGGWLARAPRSDPLIAAAQRRRFRRNAEQEGINEAAGITSRA
jgi:hypothetical protein